MLVFVISFLVGTAQLLWLPQLDISWFYISVPFILFLAIYRRVSLSLRSIQTINIILGFFLGFSFAIISGINAKSHQLQNIPSNNISVVGVIDNLPTIKPDKTKFSFQVNSQPFKKLLVSWYDTNQQVKAGQQWQLELKLKPIHSYYNPGSFDYSKWLFRHGYDATATVKSAKLLSEQSNSMASTVNNLRANIGELIQKNFKSHRVQSLIKALTIGDKSQISYADSQLFQDTGTAHLIAISGLHIGLMAFVGVLFGRLLFFFFTNERINRSKYETIFAIGFACIYAMLAGMSIPTIRALVMVVVFSLAHVFKLSINRWQAWSMALFIVLMLDPFGVLDVGLWFSFGAVAVLMFAFSGRKLSKNKFSTFVKAQIIILIGLMPLMVLVFQKVNLLTPFANILVLPLASLLLIPLIFASLFVYVFSSSIAGVLFVVVEKIALILLAILDYLQQFNFLNLKMYGTSSLSYVLLIVVMVILLLPKLFRWRYLSLFLLIPLFINQTNKLELQDFQVNVLDVGQGLSVVVQTKEHTLIYDTGAKFDSGFSLVRAVVIPYLQSQSIENVDAIIISHNDNDHAGGIDELRKNYPQADVFGVSSGFLGCQYPNSWSWDGVEFKVLSPLTLQPYFGNNSSCVLKISSINGSILLTGDIEEAVEYRLINKFPEIIKSDVLFVPHHGSRTSSSSDFIQQVNPNYAINSSGYANQFNHPHPKIKQSYQEKGIKFYDTQELGMLEAAFKRSGNSIQNHKINNLHFWNIFAN